MGIRQNGRTLVWFAFPLGRLNQGQQFTKNAGNISTVNLINDKNKWNGRVIGIFTKSFECARFQFVTDVSVTGFCFWCSSFIYFFAFAASSDRFGRMPSIKSS